MDQRTVSLEDLLPMFSAEFSVFIEIIPLIMRMGIREWYRLLAAPAKTDETKAAFGIREVLLQADRNIQQLIVRKISQVNSHALFIAEESPATGQEKFILMPDMLKTFPKQAVVVDPIDGSLLAKAGQGSWLTTLGYMLREQIHFGATLFPVMHFGRICLSETQTNRLVWGQFVNPDLENLTLLPVRQGTASKKPFIRIGYRMPTRPIFQKFLAKLEDYATIVPAGASSAGLTDVAIGLNDGFIEDRVKVVDVVAGFSHLQASGRWLQIYTRNESGARQLLSSLSVECLAKKISCFMAGNEHGREVIEKVWRETMPADES